MSIKMNEFKNNWFGLIVALELVCRRMRRSTLLKTNAFHSDPTPPSIPVRRRIRSFTTVKTTKELAIASKMTDNSSTTTANATVKTSAALACPATGWSWPIQLPPAKQFRPIVPPMVNTFTGVPIPSKCQPIVTSLASVDLAVWVRLSHAKILEPSNAVSLQSRRQLLLQLLLLLLLWLAHLSKRVQPVRRLLRQLPRLPFPQSGINPVALKAATEAKIRDVQFKRVEDQKKNY